MKPDRDKLYPWLTILRAKFMGSGRAMALEKHFGSIERALKASAAEITAVPGFSTEIANSIREAAKGVFDREVEKELKWAEREGVSILLHSDRAYPFMLRHIPAVPALLFVKGEIRVQDVLSFAIVGSRTASDGGKRMANRIAYELSEAGLSIVSGLAWGIDGSAHKGALKSKTGRTIAVLGNGLSMVYPREHGLLAEQVVKRGALVTELFHDVSPQGKNFPPRNRIISGLSLGVLIVEAPTRSGSLITANYALEQGKEIFALPGSADGTLSAGTNKLIQDCAAKLVTSSADILVELEDKIHYYSSELEGKIPGVDIPNVELPVEIKQQTDSIKPEENPVNSPQSTIRDDVQLTPDEQAVTQTLSSEPKHIDSICRELEWNVARVSAALGLLEFKDIVEREPGMRFRLKD